MEANQPVDLIPQHIAGQKRPPGRPSSFSLDTAAAICSQLALGHSLRSVCRQEGMPDISTVMDWLIKRPQFAEQYARAKEESAEVHAEDTLAIADDLTEDPNSRRVRVDARKWIASKLKPKKYGDKLDVQHTHTLDQLLGAVPVIADPLASAKPAIDSTSVDITPVEKPDDND